METGTRTPLYRTKKFWMVVVIVVIAAGVALFTYTKQNSDNPFSDLEPENAKILSTVVPSNFVSGIQHPYLTYEPGTVSVYDLQASDESVVVEEEATSETKEILGVTTMVIIDRDILDGVLEERTVSWMAQDKEGNVWLFGEFNEEYKNGKVDKVESWEAGVDGAIPGIIMKADPQPGDIYLNEYHEDVEETGTGVISRNASVSTQLGTYEDCLQLRSWSPQTPREVEYKYYCKDVRGLVLDEIPKKGERVELIEVRK